MKISESKYALCLYFASNALARRTEKLAQESWSRVDLSPSHAYLLMLVLEQPGIQPGDLARQLQLKPSTITRLIEKLEEKKLLSRETEGKLTNVYPSSKAKDLLPKMKECVNEFSARYAAILGKDECNHFVQMISKVADKLKP